MVTAGGVECGPGDLLEGPGTGGGTQAGSEAGAPPGGPGESGGPPPRPGTTGIARAVKSVDNHAGSEEAPRARWRRGNVGSASEGEARDDEIDLSAPAAGRPLRIVLLGFYNYFSHALRIFHPLLAQRGHEVHSVFVKNQFTYGHPTQQEEDMVVDRVASLRPDVVAASVWSTYFQLAARLTERIKERTGAVAVWG